MCDQEQLMAYLDGEASGAMAAHLEECADCRALAEDLRAVSARMIEWGVEPPSAGLDRRVRAALAPENKRSRRWWPWALSATGVVAVGLLAVAIRPGPRMQSVPLQRVVAEMAVPTAGAPLIARTAQIALTTSAFDQARRAIDDILAHHQGYFGDMNLTSPTDAGRTLTATIRVPASQLDATLAELRRLGRVESESQSGEDVTAQSVDLDARLANARHTEERLTDLLRQRTGNLADVLAVEKELDNTRGEIERMEAEQKALATRVAYATVSVTLTEGHAASAASTFSRLRNAAADGFRSLGLAIVAVALFLLAWGPSIVVFGGLVWLIWRGVRRLVIRRTP
jgi:hypothetical protein